MQSLVSHGPIASATQPSANQPLGPQNRTYADAFSNPSLDPNQGFYADILPCFDPLQHNIVTPVFLVEQAGQQQIRIYCLHAPSKFVSALSGRAMPWDGKGYAFLGEVTQGVTTTVEVSKEAFQPILYVRVQKLGYIQDHLYE